ncbi:MAG: helix-hairpin-helix domain-containing protein [Prevotellaceae bacterium]|jgi:competence ComEA-like helix-hairpin-helix protein|nr:helix-hairpin-helix domain-containing protein [Prevotellaceae bacterium]
MWKDFFHFSRGQRTGVIVLLILIAGVFTLSFFLSAYFEAKNDRDTAFLDEAKEFRANLQSRDSIMEAERQRQYEERYKKRKEYDSKQKKEYPARQKTEYTLFVFDPNKADSAAFVNLGLRANVASSIIKYRNKGGVFRKASDFAKIYGITPGKFAELEAYISIAQDSAGQQVEVEKRAETIFVELNSADTAELMRVKGIGRSYARNIIRFRDESGGFVSVEQLQDVYGMRPENYERIRPYCIVNRDFVRKINVNSATVDHLKRHPYLNFYQSKAIYDLRRKKGKLNSIDDLKKLKDLSPELLSKIEPYLNFE